MSVKMLRRGSLGISVYNNGAELAKNAADMIADTLKRMLLRRDRVNVIFTASPTIEGLLSELAKKTGIDWQRVNAFYTDEIISGGTDALLERGKALKDTLFDQLPFLEVYYINPKAKPHLECYRYTELLEKYPPDIAVFDLDENGSPVVYDPFHFELSKSIPPRILHLKGDKMLLPSAKGMDAFNALSLTAWQLMSAKAVFCIAYGPLRAGAVYQLAQGDINNPCRTAALREHENANLLCDIESGGKLLFRPALVLDEVSPKSDIAVSLACKYNPCAIELRSVDGRRVDLLTAWELCKINTLARQRGLEIALLHSSVFRCPIPTNTASEQFEILKRCLIAASSVGTKLVRISSFESEQTSDDGMEKIVEYIDKAARMAKESGITLLIAPEPFGVIKDARRLYRLLSKLNHPNLAAAVRLSEDMEDYAALQGFCKHLYMDCGENLQNAVFSLQMRRLLENGYDGFITLSPHAFQNQAFTDTSGDYNLAKSRLTRFHAHSDRFCREISHAGGQYSLKS